MKRIFTNLMVGLASFLSAQEMTAQTVTDNQGNVYNVITIGSQQWMKENLKVTKYNNGDNISTTITASVWSAFSEGGYCYYGNDSATNRNIYGALYNFFAVSDSRGVCPAGFHIPSIADWDVLINLLGGPSVAGGLLGEAGTTHWSSTNGSDSVGFTALPGGLRVSGNYASIGNYCGFWASDGGSYPPLKYIAYDTPEIKQAMNFPTAGISVRCVSDGTATGMRDAKENPIFKIQPNPSNGKFFIQSQRSMDLVEVFNMVGEKVYQSSPKESNFDIDLSSKPSGIYFLKVHQGGKTSVQKVVLK